MGRWLIITAAVVGLCGSGGESGYASTESPLAGAPAGQGTLDSLAQADRAYADRGRDAHDGGRASPERIQAAIAGYEDALAQAPEDVSVRWRLLRALYFAGDFSAEPVAARRAYLDRGREVARVGLEKLAGAHGDGKALEQLGRPEVLARVPGDQRRDVGILYFWTALLWGAWAQTGSTFDAVREGVANRLYDYSEVVLALTPSYYTGGIHRLRSHMHATLPRVPFLSGWVDRDRAVPEAQAALQIAPRERGNHTVYAMALLETRADARGEALEILREVVSLEPRPESRVEDLAVRELARSRIAEEVGDDR